MLALAPVFLVIIGSVAATLVANYHNKILTRQGAPAQVVSIMFIGCLALAIGGAVIFGTDWGINGSILAVGALNAVGAWAFSRSIKIDLSTTLLIMPLSQVIPIGLSAALLGEAKLLDPRQAAGFLTLAGSILLILATTCFAVSDRLAWPLRRQWLVILSGFVIILGLVHFLMKYFAAQEVTLATFLSSWYAGAVLGSLLGRTWEKAPSAPLTSQNFWRYGFLSLGTITSLGGIYWALTQAPTALVFTLFTFLYVLGSVITGLFLFNERTGFRPADWLGVAVGALGAIAVVIGVAL